MFHCPVLLCCGQSANYAQRTMLSEPRSANHALCRAQGPWHLQFAWHLQLEWHLQLSTRDPPDVNSAATDAAATNAATNNTGTPTGSATARPVCQQVKSGVQLGDGKRPAAVFTGYSHVHASRVHAISLKVLSQSEGTAPLLQFFACADSPFACYPFRLLLCVVGLCSSADCQPVASRPNVALHPCTCPPRTCPLARALLAYPSSHGLVNPL